MSVFGTLHEMIQGGVAVNVLVDPQGPKGAEGPALIRTVVQLDGDIVSRVSPDLMKQPQDVIVAELERHLADVRDAVRPVRRLKAIVDWLGDGIAAIGAGTAIGGAANAAFAEAGTGDPLTAVGIGVLAVPLGFAIPAVLGSQLRQTVNILILLGRTRPGRWFVRKVLS
ncbi:MAG: hypothetical protein AAFX92_12295 [Pseudomonadota bacterium]